MLTNKPYCKVLPKKKSTQNSMLGTNQQPKSNSNPKQLSIAK